MTFKLAWRNIWRNKKRSLITMASIFFAVLLAVFMRSLQKGTYKQMIENVAGFYTGYAQIHQKGYNDEPVLDNTFEADSALLTIVRKEAGVAGIIPRLESFALASFGEETRPTMVVGIDPERENSLTGIKDRIIEGKYLEGTKENAVIIGSGLADKLNLSVGDSVVLLGQGYHGATAAGLFPVKGIIKIGSPDLNNRIIYLPLQQAQYLYNTIGRLTSYSLMINEPENVELLVSEIRTKLPEDKEILTWMEISPELEQMIKADNAGGIIPLGILYMVITFGIFGTILMMIKEREYEFGVLISIGMKKLKLTGVLIVEIWMMALLGAMAGLAVSIPLVYYFNVHPITFTGEMAKVYEDWGIEPILPTSTDPSIYLTQALIIFIVSSVLAFYPLYKISSLEPVSAMRR